MNKKIYPIIIFTLLVASLFTIQLSSAYPVNVYSNSVSQSTYSGVETASSHGSGMSFVGNNGYLQTVTYQLKKAAGATGAMTVYVYDNAGSGSNYYPLNNATAIDWSTTNLDVSTLSSASYGYFSFDFTQHAQLLNGHYYSVVLKCNGTVSDWVYVGVSGSGFFPLFSNSDTYSASSLGQIVGYVIVELDAPATPTPTPVPTATPANGSHWIWNGTAWVNDDNVVTSTTEILLPVLIPIVILLICAGVAAYFIGFWGFILGLDIGVVILRVVAGDTYMPIWGIVLIGVGNIIVLIMGRRGGE